MIKIELWEIASIVSADILQRECLVILLWVYKITRFVFIQNSNFIKLSANCIERRWIDDSKAKGSGRERMGGGVSRRPGNGIFQILQLCASYKPRQTAGPVL